MLSTDEAGLADEPVAQQSFGTEPVQRMRVGAPATMLCHRCDDPRECLGRGQVAVHQGERLAVVRADADLEPGGLAVLVEHGPTDLEPGDLSGQDAVLDADRGTAGHDERCEVGEAGVDLLFDEHRCRGGWPQRATIDEPDGRRRLEALGAAGDDPCCRRVVEQHVDVSAILLARPGECRTEHAARALVREHPRDPSDRLVAHQRGTRAERSENARSLARMIADEDSEFGCEQR